MRYLETPVARKSRLLARTAADEDAPALRRGDE
jgi:hypothetical protein